MTHIDAPTSTGRIKVVSGLARSQTKNWLFRGTTRSTAGSHPYSLWDRPIRFSGVVGNARMTDRYRPIQMGIWMTIGPRHPMGLTPCSRYNFMVSRDSSWRLLAYFCLSAWSLGLSVDIARACRIWRNVSGIVNKRTRTVNSRMVTPKLPRKLYISTRVLSIGLRMPSFQTNEKASSTLLPCPAATLLPGAPSYEHRSPGCFVLKHHAGNHGSMLRALMVWSIAWK